MASDEPRERLRRVWTEPLALDPARRSAKVTREIAAKLAELAKSLEAASHDPEEVAQFLMRCLFTMFAEDIGLLKKDSFKSLLKRIEDPDHFVPLVEELWQQMNVGGFSISLNNVVKRFNGGLFAQNDAIPLNRDQLDLLIESANKSWNDVEPAIFGTLLERALNRFERHKLGAHYTPRAYVERLVIPTVVEPLREEWDAARTAAVTLAKQGETAAAVAELERFHDRLCAVRVLDPACGTGNFLYVTLEHLKRLEGEVFAAHLSIAQRQMTFEASHTVDPHQLLGIEINPRAAAIAELVLWIGYLQWHYRTRGKVDPPEPVIKDFRNIDCRDALLVSDSVAPIMDQAGNPITHWDGKTTKTHPASGLEVPNEMAQVPSYRYEKPRQAEWPSADFIIGNPPYIGSKRMRECLGDGYVDALQKAWPDVPQASDYVLRWWHKAASMIRDGQAKRFGLIATNSIWQVYNRRVIQPHLDGSSPISLDFVTPNHPWVDVTDGAAVRISMSVGSLGDHPGRLFVVTDEASIADDGGDLVRSFEIRVGKIQADFSIGARVASTKRLKSNDGLCAVGMKTIGIIRNSKNKKDPFQITRVEAKELGLTSVPGLSAHVRPYLNGDDFAGSERGIYVVDFFGVKEEVLRARFPAAYQHLLTTAKPIREQNRNSVFRRLWWVIGHPRRVFRSFTAGLARYIATIESSKHRFFGFIDTSKSPDSTLVTFGLQDSYSLGILSSRIHLRWALSSGGRLGAGDDPRYNKSRCFETFPFPTSSEKQRATIADLGERLDAHRKRQQQLHPKLTMTGMYNVLEKLRHEQSLTPKERIVHEQGLVSVLGQIHDDLDRAVADAYGWPDDLSDQQILERLVTLNHERAEEEQRGLIRWLRPEFQNPQGTTQTRLSDTDEDDEEPVAKKRPSEKKLKRQPWPNTLAEQAAAVQAALAAHAGPADQPAIAAYFIRARKDRIGELLETLVSLGRARQLDDGRYLAV